MQQLTLKERQWRVREDTILDAARALLEEQGYADMSMDDLAARVGVSKATLYQHFPSKEELAMRVIARGMQTGMDDLLGQDPSLPAITRLERSFITGIRRRAMMWTSRVPSSVVRHPMYAEQRARIISILTALVDEAKAQGDARPDLPTPVIVYSLMSLYRIDFDALLADGTLTEADISCHIVSLALDGIRTRRL